MPVELASAYVSIIPTTKGIGADLEKELSGPLEAAAKKAGADTGKALDETGKKFTKFGIGGLAVAGALGAGLLKTGQSASDLGESVNAVRVTFGDAADGILKLGEDAATSVGLSNSAFNGLAVQFSSFATTIAGKGGDVTSTMQEMTGRAADFASVMNIDVADAAAIFQSGLAGETEPLKKFGIDLSAAAVNAYAAANGIGTVGKELTESEKVTARYGLLMEQTAKTQGDFANTSDSAANATRIAKAEMENASASLGASLTPAMAFAATTVGTLAKGFATLNEATDGWLSKGLGIGVLALGAASAVSLVVGQVIKFRSSLESIKGAMVNAEGGLTRVGKATKFMGQAMVVAGIGLAAYAWKQQMNAQNAQELAAAMDEVTRAGDQQAQQISGVLLASWINLFDMKPEDAAKRLAKENLGAAIRTRDLAAANADFAAQLEQSGITVNMLTSAINGEAVAKKRSEDASKTATAAVDDLTEATDDTTGAAEGLTIAELAAKGALESIAAATAEATRKTDAFAESLVTQRERTEELYGIERTAVEAKYAFAESSRQAMIDTDLLNQALASGKTKQEDLDAATRTASASIFQASEDYATLNGAALDSEAGIQRQIESLEMQAGALAPGSPLRTHIEGYISDLKSIMPKVTTVLELNIVLGQRFTKDGDVIGVRSVAPGDVNWSARGGPGDGWTVVGEEGAELVKLPQGSYVHTAAATRSMMAGSGMANVGESWQGSQKRMNIERVEVHNDVDADGFFRYANFAMAS